jgi:hypothetical protein
LRCPGVCGHRRAYSVVAPTLVAHGPLPRIHHAAAAELVRMEGELL